MAIDITNETVITFTEATHHLPRRRKGKRPNITTIHRWANEGRKGIYLEFIMIGATRCTSMEALQRFFDRLTEAAAVGQPPVLPRTPLTKTRLRQIEAAERRLREAGI